MNLVLSINRSFRFIFNIFRFFNRTCFCLHILFFRIFNIVSIFNRTCFYHIINYF